MQEALPYRAYPPATTSRPSPASREDIKGGLTSAMSMVSENALVVFGRRGCCMCHVVNRLLQGHGVNPAVFEVDEGQEEGELVEALSRIVNGVDKERRDDDHDQGSWTQLPAVFVGGKLFGGLDRLMATHITGELVPILKEAGALWL